MKIALWPRPRNSAPRRLCVYSHWLIVLLTGLLIVALLAGSPPPGHARLKKGKKRSYFQPITLIAWRVVDLSNPLRPDFLIGTAHIPVNQKAKLQKAFVSALKTCDVFISEADINAVTPDVVGRYVSLDGDKRLSELLPPDSWSKLQVETKSLGLGSEQLSGLEPWYASLLLTFPINLPGDKLLDEVLRSAAEQQKLEVQFLETPQEVLGAMDRVARSESVGMLVETLQDLKRTRAEYHKIEEAYWGGNLVAIHSLLLDVEKLKKFPDFYERLLYERNRAWWPKIDASIRTRHAVIAVGLGHLIGPEGLLRRLVRDGYRVDQVKL